jgi:hypothetical protein
MARQKQFPKPSEVSDADPVAWRSTDDIVEIANAMNEWNYSNLAEAVRAWVVGHALSLGWSKVHFPLAYPSKTLRAGAVFIK